MKLCIEGVYFSYNSVSTLNDVTLDIGAGEIVSIVGPNGSGKSTILKCIDRILKPRSGAVTLDGKDIRKMELRRLARCIAYVLQSAPSGMQCTVFDAVLLGRRPHMSWRVSEKDMEITSRTLMSMGLESLAMRQFNELSGGERQRVLIARALAQEPAIMLLDEPTSNLDLKHQLEVMSLISNSVREQKISAVIAIHDLNLASRFSDRIVFLQAGRIHAAGLTADVLTPENVKNVYGVDVIINKDMRTPYIIPIEISGE